MKQRQSNIELLRCVLMLMVVTIHFLGHNLLSAAEPIDTSNPHFYTANLLLCFCECAVDCFVLISGWFSIKFTVSKLIMFLLPIAFYQFVLSIVYHFADGSPLSINAFEYWFVRPYVALMIVSPLLNKGLNNIEKKHLAILLTLLTIIFILPIQSLSGMDGKNALIFIYIYCLGHYLKNYFNNKHSKWLYLGMFVLAVMLNFAETVILAKIGHYKGTSTQSYRYDNVLILLQAVFLLLFFSKLDLNNRIINSIAVSSFFVYIITENNNIYGNQNYSIYKILDVRTWETEHYFIVKILVASVTLFGVAIIIDKVRRLFFSKLEKGLFEKLSFIEQKYLGNVNADTIKDH